MKKFLASLAAVAALVLFASPSQAQDKVSKFAGNMAFVKAIAAQQGRGICYNRCHSYAAKCLETKRVCTRVVSATFCKQWGTHCASSIPVCKARNSYGVCTDYDANCTGQAKHCVQVGQASHCAQWENKCVKTGQTCSRWGKRCYFRNCGGTTKSCAATKSLCLKPAKVCSSWGTHCSSSAPKCVKKNAYGVCIDFDAQCTGQGKHCTGFAAGCAQSVNVCAQYKYSCSHWFVKYRDL